MSKTLPKTLPEALYGPIECKTIRPCSGGPGLKMSYRTEAGLPVLPHIQEAIDHSVLRDHVTEAGPLYGAKCIMVIVPDDPQIGPAPEHICKLDMLVTYADALESTRPPVLRTIPVCNWPLF